VGGWQVKVFFSVGEKLRRRFEADESDYRDAITKKKRVFCYISYYVLRSGYYRGKTF
jgi:hypothetical protein